MLIYLVKYVLILSTSHGKTFREIGTDKRHRFYVVLKNPMKCLVI